MLPTLPTDPLPRMPELFDTLRAPTDSDLTALVLGADKRLHHVCSCAYDDGDTLAALATRRHGLAPKWQQYIAGLRTEHKAKRRLMGMLDKLPAA